MANALMHRVEVLETEMVRTVKQLQDAVGSMQGPGRDDRMLIETMKVCLVMETFSDGSVVYEVRVRPADREVV